jgi:hypothetical protein
VGLKDEATDTHGAGGSVRRRRMATGAATTLALALVLTVGILVTGQAHRDPGPRTSVAVYFLTDSSDGFRHIVPDLRHVAGTGDAGVDALRALLHGRPDGRLVNGFNSTRLDGVPFTDIHSVVATRALITVDLTRDPWDPYPNIDCVCPGGRVVMQQLVWTVQTALGSTAPVRLTVDGDPVRGILGHRLAGPVRASKKALPAGTWPITPDGRTYGTVVPPEGTDVSVQALPDLVAVVGNHGRQGYADARVVTGFGPTPANPQQALAQQEGSRDRDVPVYGIDGKVIDRFTVVGAVPAAS